MLLRTIARLRRLPKAVRNHIALGVASGFTGVLVLLWVVSVSNSVATVATPAAVIESQAGVFSTFRDGIQDQLRGLQSIGEVWQEATTELQAAPEPPVVDAFSAVSSTEALRVAPPTGDTAPVVSSDDAVISMPAAEPARLPVRIATTSRQLPVTDGIE